MKKFYSMEKVGNEANLNIYGDIVSGYEYDGAVSSQNIISEIDKLTDVSKINVYISSYGGEVQAGLAIYNALKRNKAKVITHCEGFACSIASVIFMAGDERIMQDASLLMIHNAWSFGEGNADQLRKQADDLEKISQASVRVYKEHSTLSEEEIKALMDEETWILPEEALEWGFATKIEKTDTKRATQGARASLYAIVKAYKENAQDEDKDGVEDEETDETKTKTETGEEEEESPETDEEAETEEEDEDETPEDEGEQQSKNPAEKISGFFNAILKM